MNYKIILWLGILLLGTGHARQNLFVLHKGSKFTTQSKWIASFNLQPTTYQMQLERLEVSIADISRIVNHYRQEMIKSNDNSTPFFVMLAQQVQSCKRQLSHVKYHLENTINLLQLNNVTRTKRSLLPFLGHFISSITGTATEDDIKQLNDKISQIESNDKQFRHILKDSLTIVNTTQIRLNTFHKTINHIIDSITDIVTDYHNITSTTLTELRREEYKTKVYEAISSHLQHFDRGTNLLSTELIRFDSRLSDLLHHQVSINLISPTELYTLLSDISNNLDRHLQLPFDLKTDLASYYKSLTCDSYSHNNGLGVIITIPLLSATDRVDLYEIISLPVPYANGHLQLQHQVDFNYVAVSYDKNRIAFMDHNNFAVCTQEQTVTCHVLAPFHAIHALNHSCTATLITTSSLQDCPVTIQKLTIIVPQAVSIAVGRWAVITNDPLTFHMMCLHHPEREVIVKPPVMELHLDTGCRARSLLLSLPPTYLQPSKVRSEVITEFTELNFTIINQVPPVVHRLMLTLPHKLVDMVDHSVTIQHLQERLEDVPWYSPSAVTSFWTKHWVSIVICVVLASMFLIMLVIFCVHRRRHKARALMPSAVPTAPVLTGPPVSALYPSIRAASDILHAFPQTV